MTGTGRARSRTAVHDSTAVDPLDSPLWWWELHRSLEVGDEVDVVVDTAPGGWDRRLLDQVVIGAGFTVLGERRSDEGAADGSRGSGALVLRVRRERSLADTVGPDMDLLLVGLNPSEYAADHGVGFARPGNRAWPALLAAGLATVDRDPRHMLVRHAVGMTDLAKRATARADELTAAELRAGLVRLDVLCRWLRPRAVAVMGVTGWRTATGDRHASLGTQPRSLGGRPVYVMPNPSGANAHTDVADLVEHLRRARRWC